MDDQTTLDYQTATSQSGTRHILDKVSKPAHQAKGRVTGLCGFGVLLVAGNGGEAAADCGLCLSELADIRKLEAQAAAREAAGPSMALTTFRRNLLEAWEEHSKEQIEEEEA